MSLIDSQSLSFKPLMIQLQNLNLSVPHHDFNKMVKLRQSAQLCDLLEYFVQLDNLAKFKLDDIFFSWSIEGTILSVNQLEFEKMCVLMKLAVLYGEYDVDVLKKALACAMEANSINIRKLYLGENSFTHRYVAYIKGKLHSFALDKLVSLNKSFSLTSKIAQQASNYFKLAEHKEFTIYNQAMAFYYQAQDAEQQHKFGIQVKRLEDAISCLKSNWFNTPTFNDLFAAVDEKLKSAKRDNDMIYLQIVPSEMDPIEPEDIVTSSTIDFLPICDPLFSTVLPYDILDHLKLFQDLKKEQIDPRKYHLDNLLSRSKHLLEMNVLDGKDHQLFQKFKASNLEEQLQQMMDKLNPNEVQLTLDKVCALRSTFSTIINKNFDAIVEYMHRGESIAHKLDTLDSEKGLVTILVKSKGFNKNLTDAMEKYYKENWLPVLEGLEEFVATFEQNIIDSETKMGHLQQEIQLSLLQVEQVEEEIEMLYRVIVIHLENV